MIFNLLMYVLSHGFLLSSYKALSNLKTWVYLSCVLTSSGCKCLFIVYAFFVWEASCYEYFLVFLDLVIYNMLDLIDLLRSHNRLLFLSQNYLLDIILHDRMILLDHGILNWAHRSVDKHTTHMIDHTIYSIIEEWNNNGLQLWMLFINQILTR